jgi:RNA polymerase sigma-70 factor (ECF subfamily)
MKEALRGCEGRIAGGVHNRERHAAVRTHVSSPGSRAPATQDSRPRDENWIAELRSDGPERDEAIGRLHALLLRAARFEVGRRARSVPHLRGGDQDDLALQSANDALVAVLAKLDTFRGQSRFTTWAYKFALLEAAVKVRRLAWQGREIPLEPERWPRFADAGSSPHAQTEQGELLSDIQRAIETDLTPHQREVLVALALNEVPIDVLAERLGATRGALYKTLHDARRKLRRTLDLEGERWQEDD